MNDLAPGVGGIDKIPQVVIGYDDPICFFSEVEQEPDRVKERERERQSVYGLDIRIFPVFKGHRLVPSSAAKVRRGKSAARGTPPTLDDFSLLDLMHL